jgi:hypothetical protein
MIAGKRKLYGRKTCSRKRCCNFLLSGKGDLEVLELIRRSKQANFIFRTIWLFRPALYPETAL